MTSSLNTHSTSRHSRRTITCAPLAPFHILYHSKIGKFPRFLSFLMSTFVLFFLVLIDINEIVLVNGLVITQPCCHVYEHRGAMFGPELPVEADSIFNYLPDRPKISSVTGPLKLTDASNPTLCGPDDVKRVDFDFNDAIALIPRGGCSFAEKVYFAQLLRAKAVIIFQAQDQNAHNHRHGYDPNGHTRDDDVIVMAEDSKYGPLIKIPSAFVSYNTWKSLQTLNDQINAMFNENGEAVSFGSSPVISKDIIAVINETGSLASTGPDALPMMWDSMVFLVKVFLIIWSVMGFAYITNFVKMRYRRFKRQNIIRSLPCKQYKKLQVHSNRKSAEQESKTLSVLSNNEDKHKGSKNKSRNKSGKKYSLVDNADLKVDPSNEDIEVRVDGDVTYSDLESNLKSPLNNNRNETEREDENLSLGLGLERMSQGTSLKARSFSANSKNNNINQHLRQGSIESNGSSSSPLSRTKVSKSDVGLDELDQAADSILSSNSSGNNSNLNVGSDVQLIECDSCVICLCDFEEEDFVTVLPCKHIYHKECIEPWLTNKSSLCPMCKQSIFKNGEARSISELNSEDNDNQRRARGARPGANAEEESDEDAEQRRGSIALSIAMFIVIVLSFTFMMVDDDK